ncbi:hypothetical protein MLD38_032028 [Melastoma candidum]|uniref:Uncharacterized protein n=1 Tax=Melastoma candidum TaxID=119954 RepID=A0ACB9MT83_9MYRT|nr:hypothetical protein MLD38_032028 [Melastoma candidum]
MLIDQASSRRPPRLTPHSVALLLLLLPSLLLLSQATPSLNHSDHDALVQFQLGLRIETNTSASPCDFPGVVCERDPSLSVRDVKFQLRVTRLVFESRQLRGFLSSSIGRLSRLKELSLPDNYLVDQVPSRIADCLSLEIINLRNNRLSGELPGGLSSLVRLRMLDLSNNDFSGDLSFLNHLPNLDILNVDNNRFSGKVPPSSVRSARILRDVDFSANHFLKGYDLTKRNMLVRTPSNEAPAPVVDPPAAISRKVSGGHRLGDWLVGLLVGSIAGGLVGLLFSVILKLSTAAIKGGGKEPGPVIYSTIIQKVEDLAFLKEDDVVSSLEMIGKGGCGEVYKAELPGSDGKMIAIKKILYPSKDVSSLLEEDSKFYDKKMRQIRSEIKTVGEIRHRNLLPLLAHFPRPDCHYLIYEYMKNGSLQDLLTRVSKGDTELAWSCRLRIAIGVASGLEYLHTSHNPRIIHRDLKPANILLDEDMEPRIADFGLAKAMPRTGTHISMSGVAGSVGYIAPEYHQTLKFTAKCDIYSYGVMLGVLVAGKLPSDEFFQHTQEGGIVQWLRHVMSLGNPSEAIDRRLMGNGQEEQMLLVLKIACFCTLDDPKQRPSSKDVVSMLKQIKP